MKRSYTDHLVRLKQKENDPVTDEEETTRIDHIEWEALRISDLIYQPLDHVHSQLKASGFTPVEVCWNVLGTQAVYCQKHGHAFLAFRGTSSLADLLVDLAFLPTLFTLRAPRHLGFWLAWKLCIARRVKAWLASTDSPEHGIVISGHSLGGALAQLAAYELASDHTISKVLTFGGPRAFWGWGASAYNSKVTIGEDGAPSTLGEITLRYVNSVDLVPRIPPPILGFLHVGGEKQVGRNFPWLTWIGQKILNSQESTNQTPPKSEIGIILWGFFHPFWKFIIEPVLLLVVGALYLWVSLGVSLIFHPRTNYLTLLSSEHEEPFPKQPLDSAKRLFRAVVTLQWVWPIIVALLGATLLATFFYTMAHVIRMAFESIVAVLG